MKTTKSKARAITHLSRNKHRVPQASRITCQLRFLAATLALMLAASDSLGQGTVNFRTTVEGVLSTRVYMPDTTYPFWPSSGNTSNQIPAGTQTYSGTLVAGSSFVGQLWAAPGANQPESVLQPASTIISFRTGSAAGTVVPGVATLTNIPPDTPVATLQVRVWQSGLPIPGWPGQFGWYYGVVFGKSQPFDVEVIGGGNNPPPNLLNLRSFSLVSNLLDSPVSPLIYAQPQHQHVSPGGTAIFTAETSGPVNKPVY